MEQNTSQKYTDKKQFFFATNNYNSFINFFLFFCISTKISKRVHIHSSFKFNILINENQTNEFSTEIIVCVFFAHTTNHIDENTIEKRKQPNEINTCTCTNDDMYTTYNIIHSYGITQTPM